MSLPDRAAWERIEPILDAVLEADPGDRESILRDLTGGDNALADTVRRLTAAAEEPSGSFDRPAASVAHALVLDDEPPETPTFEPGAVVAGYEILGLLGRGGMGEVYRAHHPTLERSVALKVLPTRTSTSSEARDRLVAEARAASRLDHPNIQTVYDAGETEDGRIYLALAYYDGPTLQQRLADGPLPVDEAVEIGRQLAEGLAASHARGIIHRDVKPSNLIVQEDGRLKILDFGVAAMLERDAPAGGPVYGTLSYMSPEQIRGERADARSDVWAVSAVLYEMLAGVRPFRADDHQSLIRAILESDPAPVDSIRPDVPAPIAAVVQRGLRKEPAERQPDMETLRDELVEVGLAAGPVPSGGSGRPLYAAIVAAVAVLAVATAAYLGLRNVGVIQDSLGADAGPVLPAATSMTIMPFVALAGDSSTGRLGRQLAVTVSTSLNGVGPIRTSEGLAVLTALGRDGQAGDDSVAADLARRLATRSYVRGTVLESDGVVRVDATLHDAREGGEIGRLSASAEAGDVVALTDSITFAVLRVVWHSGAIPAPNLKAVSTASVPALRAYLDGELALADGQFGEAIAAFDSAFAADTTFYYALWRSIYPRTYQVGAGIGAERFDLLFEHREELPEPDRLLLEAMREPGAAERMEARRHITRRFPGYWPGWWAYANSLVHGGPLLGIPLSETRAALDRTLEIHDGWLPGWEHLLWNAIRQRDAEGAADALARLEAAVRDGNPRLEGALLESYRAMVASIDDPGLAAYDVEARQRSVDRYAGPIPHEFFALDQLLYGGCRAQNTLNGTLLNRTERPDVRELAGVVLALTAGCAGDYRQGLAFLDEFRFRVADSLANFAYGFAVTGAWLGDVEADRATGFRPADDLIRDEEAEAERRWLDGLLAYAAEDSAALAAARRELSSHPGRHAERLARSLEAFGLALAGDSLAAARRLAELEEEASDAAVLLGYAWWHPWLTPVNRLAAARWLVAAAEEERALRLLAWDDVVLSQRAGFLLPVGNAIRPRAALVRARLYAGKGDVARATHEYGTILHQLDRPATPELAAAVAEARNWFDDNRFETPAP